MTQRHLAVLTLEVDRARRATPRSSSPRSCSTARTARTSTTTPAGRMGEATDPRKAAAFAERVLVPRLHYAREDRMMLGYQCAQLADDHRGRGRPLARDRRRGRDGPARGRGPRQDGLPGRGRRRATRSAWSRPSAYHSSRGVPVKELSDRCDRTLDRAAQHDVAHYHREQREWFDRFWESSDVQVDGSEAVRTRPARRAAGHPVQPVQPRPGERPRRRAGRGRQGRDAARATRATTSGTPRSTSSRSSPTRSPDAARNLHALPAPDAARGPAPGPGDGPERGAVPVAHDQRRGGVGLLRRGHGPGAHRRRHRLRADPVRRGDRRPRLPGPRRASTSSSRPSRMWADLGFWRSNGERPVVPHPRRHRARTSTRPSSTTTCSPT